MTRQVEDLQRQEIEAQQRLAQLEGDWTDKTADLEALRALRTFLLRKTATIDAFFSDMDRVRQYRQQGRAPDHYAVLSLEEVRQQVLGFMQRLAAECQQP
jgi:L-amino acid N-acyltransferase YncA